MFISLADGEIQELTLEFDMRLEWLTSEMKLLLNLNRLTIFTQHLDRCSQYNLKDPWTPHFRPSTMDGLPTQVTSEDDNSSSQGAERVPEGFDNRANSPFPIKSMAEKAVPESVDDVSYIVKHMSASVMIRKMVSLNKVCFALLESDWVGDGSFSGVDLILTLYEIQVSNLLFYLIFLFCMTSILHIQNVKEIYLYFLFCEMYLLRDSGM